MKRAFQKASVVFILLIVSSHIMGQSTFQEMLRDSIVWSYRTTTLSTLVNVGPIYCFYDDYRISGTKQLNGKTYWNLLFYRGRMETSGPVFYLPDSCFYLLGYPRISNQEQISHVGIRESEGRILVDKDEYMSLLSDASYWKYVGNAHYIPYELTDDNELVLYDFTKERGELYFVTEGLDSVFVDEVDTLITNDGKSRRRLALSNGCRIVEGIGCVNSIGLYLFYLNPADSFFDYALMTSVSVVKKNGQYEACYRQDFETMAAQAVEVYINNHVLCYCPDDAHPHAIDLGLPSGTKWSCSDLGAESPVVMGSLFAWGETDTKEEFTSGNYQFGLYQGAENPPPFQSICGTSHDAVHTRLGDGWRMPSVEEAEELIHYCGSSVMDVNYSKWQTITGPNGKSIVIPLTRTNNDNKGERRTGDVWDMDRSFPLILVVDNTPGKWIYISTQYDGIPIRPVYDTISGINHVQETGDDDAPVYNLAGQRVTPTTKGILVKNGRKYVNK